MPVSIPGGPLMLDLIGCAVVNTAMSHSVIHVSRARATAHFACATNQHAQMLSARNVDSRPQTRVASSTVGLRLSVTHISTVHPWRQ